MRTPPRLFLIVSAIVLLVACPTNPPIEQPKLLPTPLNVGLNEARVRFKDRRFLVRASGDAYHPQGLVGHVIYVRQKDGKCPDAASDFYDAFELSGESFLTPNAKLTEATPNKVLFSSKVDRSAAATLGFVAFGAKTDSQKVSELSITDVQTVAIPDGGLIANWETAASAKQGSGDCGAVLVRTATVTVAQSKDFRKISANAEVKATAFNAGGSFYEEIAGTNSEVLVSLDVSRVRSPAKTGEPKPPSAGITFVPRSLLVRRVVALR